MEGAPSDAPGDTAVDAGIPAPEGDPATIPLAGACPLATRFGGFTVEVNPDYSAIDGKVLAAVVPVTVLTEVATDGECRLHRKENPWCDPACAGDETCDLTEVCIDYPLAVDLGDVTIAGLVEDVRLTPAVPGYRYFDTELDHPTVVPGALVELRTAGGAFEPVRLHGVGVEPLTMTETEWTLTRDQAFTVHWNGPTAAVRSHVLLALSVDQHGVTPGSISCEFVDDGEGEIPATLVRAMLDAGVTGYPNGRLSRQTVDSVGIGEGCMDLSVTYPLLADRVNVSGHTPCKQLNDCPPGHPCDLATETCE